MTDKQNDMNVAALKTCPFCNGPVYIENQNQYHFVTHVRPTPRNCIGASFQAFIDRNELITAWNTRNG
jgi:hypothetical protein